MQTETDHSYFMRRAIELSRTGMRRGDGGPFGAVVVHVGKIVGEGWNKVLVNKTPTAHAEIEAINDACQALDRFDLSGCVIHASTEPCPMCLGAIYWARLKRLYFGAGRDQAAAAGFDDARFYEELARPATARNLPQAQFLADEAWKVLEEWRGKEDKTLY